LIQSCWYRPSIVNGIVQMEWAVIKARQYDTLHWKLPLHGIGRSEKPDQDISGLRR
jgi:hypothetical protein